MTDDRNFDRLARAWLELGPDEAPDRAVSAVLQAVETTPQVRPLSRRLPWRFPTMSRLPIAAAVLVAVLIVVGGVVLTRSNDQSGVGGPVPSASATSSAASAGVVASSPSAAQASPVAPSLFTSSRYGYSLSLPAPWALASPATATWDGSGSPGFDAPEVDLFSAPSVVAWAVAAPTRLTLADYALQASAEAAAGHGCPPKPDSDEPITVGGQPARLLTSHCGILVLSAITIHNGSAVIFGFQSPFGHPNTDAADRALFLTFLDAIRLPG